LCELIQPPFVVISIFPNHMHRSPLHRIHRIHRMFPVIALRLFNRMSIALVTLLLAIQPNHAPAQAIPTLTPTLTPTPTPPGQQRSLQTPRVFTLSQAIAIALEKNYAIRLAGNDATIAENNTSGLGGLGAAGMLPSLNANGAWTQNRDNVEQRFIADGRVLQRVGAVTDRTNALVQLSWTLFDGLAMFAVRERLGELEKQSRLLLRQAIETTAAQVMTNYYTVVEQSVLLATRRTALTLSRERLAIADAKLRFGSASELDVQNARVDFNADSAAYIRQNATLYNTKTALLQVMGDVEQFPDADFEVQDSILLSAQYTLAALKERVRARNPLLLSAQTAVNIAAISIREVEAQHWPLLSANLNYNFSNVESQAGVFSYNRSNGLTYNLTAQFNIFSGFNIQRQVQNARVSALSGDFQYRDVENQLLSQMQQTYRNFQNSVLLVELERDNVRLAQSAANIALEKFRLGAMNSLDLRIVQQNYILAESRTITALADAKRAEIELLRLTGDILPRE
jgi:outer membrane protein